MSTYSPVRRRAWAAVIILALAVAGLVAFIVIDRAGRAQVTGETLKSSFEEVAEFAVEDYSYSSIGTYDGEKMHVLGVDVPWTEKSFIVTYRGEVKAGIKDMEAVEFDLDEDKQTVTVTAPKVEVLSSTIDQSSVEQYDQSITPFNQVQVRDVSEFMKGREDDGQKEAVKAGLLDRAEKRAEDLLVSQVKATLGAAGVGDYEVTVDWK